MTDIEFLKLVERMRTHQRNYFRTRNYMELQKSIQLERRVDQYLNKALEGIPLTIEQQTLFSNEN